MLAIFTFCSWKMASFEENDVDEKENSSCDEIGSPDGFNLTSDKESVSSPWSNTVGLLGTSNPIDNLQRTMKLSRINSKLAATNDQKDIFIANLEEQIDELKQEKSELKQEKVGLQETNTALNRQLHEMRERHIAEINKFHDENMRARFEAQV